MGITLTGGDVICISIHICVFKGEGGESTTGSDLLLGVRVFCRAEEGVGGGDGVGEGEGRSAVVVGGCSGKVEGKGGGGGGI